MQALYSIQKRCTQNMPYIKAWKVYISDTQYYIYFEAINSDKNGKSSMVHGIALVQVCVAGLRPLII